MFMNYFRRIAIKRTAEQVNPDLTSLVPTGKLRITRKVLSEAPDWSRSTAELCELEVFPNVGYELRSLEKDL